MKTDFSDKVKKEIKEDDFLQMEQQVETEVNEKKKMALLEI